MITVAEKTIYHIHGYFFDEPKRVIPYTQTHFIDSDTMLLHQRAWYEEAKEKGFESGEIDEQAIIKSNYSGDLTNDQLLAIVNNGDLMNTPFCELFPKKINAYLIELLKAEQKSLKDYVLEGKSNVDYTEDIARMAEINREISRIAFHDDE